MGFTAVDGLPMGTRCGAIDPGVMLYLMDELKMDARAIETLIYQQSGLLGVSGLSSDMRTLLASTDPRAAPAARWVRSRLSSAGWTAWCSPGASASMLRRSARGYAATRTGSAWSLTRTQTRRAGRVSARDRAVRAHGSSRPTRS